MEQVTNTNPERKQERSVTKPKKRFICPVCNNEMSEEASKLIGAHFWCEEETFLSGGE